MGIKAADPGKKERKIRPELPGHTRLGAQDFRRPRPAAALGERPPSDSRRRARSDWAGPAPPPAPCSSPPLGPSSPHAGSPPGPSAAPPPLSPPPPPRLLVPMSPPSSLLPPPPDTPAPEERAAEGTGRLLPPAAALSAVQPQPGSPRSPRAGPPALARRGLADLPEPARRPRSAPAFPSAPSPSAAPGLPEHPTRAPAPALSPARTEEARASSPGRPCPKRRGKSGVGPGGVAGVRRGSAGGERPAALASLPGNPGTELGTRVAPQIPGAQLVSRQGGDYSWDSGVARPGSVRLGLFPWVAEWLWG